MAWRFEDAVLTQSGPAFMHAAVTLLISVLLFTCDDTLLAQGGERSWRLCKWMGDKELRALVCAGICGQELRFLSSLPSDHFAVVDMWLLPARVNV